MPLFFVERENVQGKKALIQGDEAHHVRDVFRMRTGEPIRLFDGKGHGYIGKISEITKKKVEVLIESEWKENAAAKPSLVLIQSVIESSLMDWIVRKSTELGMEEFIPVLSERSQNRPSPAQGLRKMNRWDEIALSACKQSERLRLPRIHPIRDLKEVIPELRDSDLALLADPNAGQAMPLKGFLSQWFSKKETCERILIMIGPEGGFSDREITGLLKSGAQAVSLGLHILRSETAAIYFFSVISYLFIK